MSERETRLSLIAPTDLSSAVAAVGPGPLTEDAVAAHLAPLFSKTLARPGSYLATHSLGRPLDAVERDLAEGAALWQHALTAAWEPWLAEEHSYRVALAALCHAPGPHCIVPRVSAGPALRTVLNMLPAQARVLSTTGEFTSIAMLLAQYASLLRIRLTLASPSAGRDQDRFETEVLCEAVREQAVRGEAYALVVVSHVFFATGQLLPHVHELARACHESGSRLLIDSYHSLGALPVDVSAMECDYLVGGCYKYLRAGPGAAFLYLSPGVLAAGLRPLDTGWFALESEWQTDQGPRLRQGADAFLEGTPPVLTYYQARSGLAFAQALGVDRLRAYSLAQLARLRTLLGDRGVAAEGGDAEHGAFLVVRHPEAQRLAARLVAQGITVNARGAYLRLCPDCLTRDDELVAASDAVAAACRDLQ